MMKLLPKNAGKRVRFELSAKPGSKVFVAGTFNNWKPTANQMKDNPDNGLYKAVLLVPRGTHEYKFVVNGVWTEDPNCQDWALNGYGSVNSIIDV